MVAVWTRSGPLSCRGGNYRAKRMKLSHMVISQGCARPDARRNWLIYRCFRLAKTSKKAELDYAACTNCFIQMQFKGRASFADCKGEFKEAIVLDNVLAYIRSSIQSISPSATSFPFFPLDKPILYPFFLRDFT